MSESDSEKTTSSSKDVFISYRHVNKDLVKPIKEELKRRGISVFKDHDDIDSGMDYSETIARAIKKCKILLVVWTQEADQSKHMLREIEMAFDLHKKVIPYKVGSFDVTEHNAIYYQLSHIDRQEADPHQTPESIKKLVDQIERILKRENSSNPPEPASDSAEGSESKRFDWILIQPWLKPLGVTLGILAALLFAIFLVYECRNAVRAHNAAVQERLLKAGADELLHQSVQLRKEKLYHDAIDKIDQALELYPDDVQYKKEKQIIETESRKEANSLFNQSVKLRNRKEFNEAEDRINQALKLYPDDVNYKNEMSNIVSQRRAEAERLFSQAAALRKEKKFDEAEDRINQAEDLCPDESKYDNEKKTIEAERRAEAETIYNQAVKLQNEKKRSEALDRINQALGLYPDDVKYRRLKLEIDTSLDPFSVCGEKAGDRAVKVINGVEFPFRWCPPGTFIMGSPNSETGRCNKEIQRSVKVSKGFWMMETEITQKQWNAIMGNNPAFHKDENCPVEKISWRDCQAFCSQCSKMGFKLQLPTEAQWEYACRAGSKTAYCWGSALNGDRANCNGNNPCGTKVKGKCIGKTVVVSSYKSNAWGLYDMHGNVWEWCADKYPVKYLSDQSGYMSDSDRVCRGGSWISSASECRSATRINGKSTARFLDLGARFIICNE